MKLWTFAEDYWRSKTTQLAMVTVVGAITAVVTHKASWQLAASTAIITVAISFLRDTHAKYADYFAEILQYIENILIEGQHPAVPAVVAVPAPVIAEFMPPVPGVVPTPVTFSPEQIAVIHAAIGTPSPNLGGSV